MTLLNKCIIPACNQQCLSLVDYDSPPKTFRRKVRGKDNKLVDGETITVSYPGKPDPLGPCYFHRCIWEGTIKPLYSSTFQTIIKTLKRKGVRR